MTRTWSTNFINIPQCILIQKLFIIVKERSVLIFPKIFERNLRKLVIFPFFVGQIYFNLILFTFSYSHLLLNKLLWELVCLVFFNLWNWFNLLDTWNKSKLGLLLFLKEISIISKRYIHSLWFCHRWSFKFRLVYRLINF